MECMRTWSHCLRTPSCACWRSHWRIMPSETIRQDVIPSARHADFSEVNGYSIAERMEFGGHNNPDTFFGSYAPEISTVNGMTSYWNKVRRTVHLEGFRGLSLHHHTQLLQSLSVKVKADLNNCADFVAINNEIKTLKKRLRRVTMKDESQRIRARREELY